MLFLVWRLKVRWRQQVSAKRQRRILSSTDSRYFFLRLSFTDHTYFFIPVLTVGRYDCQTRTQVYAANCVCVCVCVCVCARARARGKKDTDDRLFSPHGPLLTFIQDREERTDFIIALKLWWQEDYQWFFFTHSAPQRGLILSHHILHRNQGGEWEIKRHLLDLTFRISRQPLVEPAGLLIMDVRLNNKVQEGIQNVLFLFFFFLADKKLKTKRKKKKDAWSRSTFSCKSPPAAIRSARPELPNLTDFSLVDLQIKTRGCTLYQKVFSSRVNQASTSRESNRLAATAALQAGAQSWSWGKKKTSARSASDVAKPRWEKKVEKIINFLIFWQPQAC